MFMGVYNIRTRTLIYMDVPYEYVWRFAMYVCRDTYGVDFGCCSLC